MLIPYRFIIGDLGNAKLSSDQVHSQAKVSGEILPEVQIRCPEQGERLKGSQETDDFRKHKSGKLFTKTEMKMS